MAVVCVCPRVCCVCVNVQRLRESPFSARKQTGKAWSIPGALCQSVRLALLRLWQPSVHNDVVARHQCSLSPSVIEHRDATYHSVTLHNLLSGTVIFKCVLLHFICYFDIFVHLYITYSGHRRNSFFGFVTHFGRKNN